MATEVRPWATAQDSRGLAWPLRVSLAQAMKLRAAGKVDLLGTDAARTALQAATDPVLLIEIAFILSAAQRAELNVSDEGAFFELFDGDSVQDLIDASVEALIDFFQSDRRKALTAIWNRQKSARNRAIAAVVEKATSAEVLDAIDRAADQAADSARVMR